MFTPNQPNRKMSFINIGDTVYNKRNVYTFKCTDDVCSLTLNFIPNSISSKSYNYSDSKKTIEFKKSECANAYNQARSAWEKLLKE